MQRLSFLKYTKETIRKGLDSTSYLGEYLYRVSYHHLGQGCCALAST